MTWQPHEALKVATLGLLAVCVFVSTAWLNYKIGERNAGAADEIAAFKQAVREEIVARFRAEQLLAQQQRDEIHADAAEAKDLAKRALTAPKTTVVLTVRTPLPVIVATPPPPTPSPTPSPTISTKPRGLLEFFGR